MTSLRRSGSDDFSDEASLRTKIANYKRTREWSRGPIREWCDSLIADAERELAAMKSRDRKTNFPIVLGGGRLQSNAHMGSFANDRIGKS